MRFPILLHKSDEGFDVSVPALPGCCSQGATEAEALENIEIAIEEYLAVRHECEGALAKMGGSEPNLGSVRRRRPGSP